MSTTTRTTVLDATAQRPDTDPTRRLRYTLTTGMAVLGPILFTLSNVFMPKLSGSTADVVARLPAVANRLLALHLMYALGSLLMVAFVIALWRISASRGGWLRFAGGVLMIIGAVSNAFGEIVDGYLGWGMHQSGVAAGAQVRLLDLLDNSKAALPISFLAIPVLSLGLLAMMAGVLVGRVRPIWPAILVIVSGIAAGFVGVGAPALVGLVWAVAAGWIVLTVAQRQASS